MTPEQIRDAINVFNVPPKMLGQPEIRRARLTIGVEQEMIPSKRALTDDEMRSKLMNYIFSGVREEIRDIMRTLHAGQEPLPIYHRLKDLLETLS